MIRLFRLLVPASVLTLFVSEAALIFGSYLAVVYFARPADQAFLDRQDGWLRLGVLTGLMLLGMYFRQLYADLRAGSRILLLQQLAFVMGMAFLGEALIGYWNLSWAVPRWILLPGSALVLVALFFWRRLFSTAIRNKVGQRRVLFLGFSPAIEQVTEMLSRQPEVGFEPIGYLDHQDDVSATSRLAWLGSPAKLYSVLEECRPDWLVVGKRDEIEASQADDFLEMRFGGVQTEDAAGFFERMLGRICATEVRPQDVIWSEGLQPDRLNVRLQSMYSTALALGVAIPLLPLAALAALCAAGSKGPALAREPRLGLYGEPFVVYLFRFPGNRLGRMLRRCGLHHLPQIWNVIMGQMSFVGPEADRPEFASRLNAMIPFYAQRTAVRPGITGWAQINQLIDGSGGDAVKRLEYDLYYVKNVSPLLDFFVMLRAIRELAFLRPGMEAGARG
jgi:lipopolysaccharide/colanic/teichoic acid biosynthesis glycosyltransferase